MVTICTGIIYHNKKMDTWKLLLGVCALINLGYAAEWGFKDGVPTKLGPLTWKDEWPVCAGTRQSPINIKTEEAVFDEDIAYDKLYFSQYDTPFHDYSLEHDGHTVKVSVEDYDSRGITISGGGLPGRYYLAQFHFHWGSRNNQGAEHTLDGFAYAAVLHLVHHKQDYLANLDVFASVGDGAAVIGVFIEVGQHNYAFDSMINNFERASNPAYEDQDIEISLPPLREFLPHNTEEFYRYYGSLTTPGCTETVIWTVMKNPIQISQQQLNRFRTAVKIDKDKPALPPNLLVDNFRPVQPLYGRTVYTTIKGFPEPGPQVDAGIIAATFFGGLAAGVIIAVICCFACGDMCLGYKRHSKSKTTIISQAAPTYGYPQVQPQMQFQPQMQQFQPASQGVSVIRLQ